MEIFFLTDDISTKCGFKYVLSIIDQFSKWIWSYPLKEKSAHECLLCLMNYVYAFGFPKKLHIDNGKEFKNIQFNIFCSGNNINHVFSKPYTPKSNGCIEASHKEIKKFINDKFYTNEKESIDLNEVLLNAINNHNNIVYSTTNYKPIDLKNDLDIINLVKSNIENKITKSITQKQLNLIEEVDYLLVFNNISFKKDEIIKCNKKRKGEFTTPTRFIKYTKNNKLKIEIVINYKKDDVYIIESNLCREVNEAGFNYYL